MPSVSRTFDVDAPPAAAVDYLADFGNAPKWDPGTQKCDRNDDGPVRVGSSWENESKIAGVSTELTYTLEKLTDAQIVLVGRNKTATSTETIDVVPNGAGSTITYTNDVEYNGAAKLAGPITKVIFEKLGGEVEDNLVRELNGLAAR